MENLKEVLELHKKWLKGEKGGIRAVLRYVNLKGADLSYVDLSYADLSYADLSYADLSRANLREVDLRYADLRDADLSGAILRGADLRDADLRYVNLSGAILRGADLRYADLRGADLRDADLSGAILRGADLRDIKYNYLSIGLNLVCPEEGSYIGYKKAKNKQKEEVIIKILITEDALRSSAATRKCRCSKAKVLSITSLDNKKSYNEAYSNRDKTFIYKVGETVEVDNFDANRWNECAPGIHHFITRKEAAEY